MSTALFWVWSIPPKTHVFQVWTTTGASSLWEVTVSWGPLHKQWVDLRTGWWFKCIAIQTLSEMGLNLKRQFIGVHSWRWWLVLSFHCLSVSWPLWGKEFHSTKPLSHHRNNEPATHASNKPCLLDLFLLSDLSQEWQSNTDTKADPFTWKPSCTVGKWKGGMGAWWAKCLGFGIGHSWPWIPAFTLDRHCVIMGSLPTILNLCSWLQKGWQLLLGQHALDSTRRSSMN